MKNLLICRLGALFIGLFLIVNSGFSASAIRARGSESTMPVVKALAISFLEKSGTIVYVNGGGSRAGAKAAMAEEIELAFLSRPLDAKETAGGLVAVVYARDAISGIAIFATKGFPTGDVKAFIEFALSKEGQAIVVKNELLAIN